ncbi:hypothetical protein [Parasphaerochaeta coccoides]|uniref:Uncharacterized protein n=1 Tax=Parasphaerochaeta coccoides (strain ATCC BAA-1237 / DSM 17374 / SPN1) TaxID=760011 RepID=F4GIJ3_PARC1|nr:hypothetical protein [Parasphaerochaeta coccoides]AEC02127.1 hypothetical protein Spico_0903 [Parasphaerochaeta coccoides DSM 17374]
MNPRYLPFIQEKDGIPATFLPIAPLGEKLPTYLFQGKKQPLWYISGDTITPIYWTNIVPAGDMQCIYFDRLDLESFETLASSRRSEALRILQDFARALLVLGKDMVSVENGLLPLWKMWIVSGGGFLVLSRTISELMASSLNDDGRHEGWYAWATPRTNPAFTLCHQFTQMLYFALMGFPPFFTADTREDKFRFFPVPHDLHHPEMDSTCDWINSMLRLSIPRQQDAAGNKNPVSALSWWLEASRDVTWTVPEQAAVTVQEAQHRASTSDEKARTFFAHQVKRASHRRFWRKRGTVIIAVVIAVAAISWFTADRIRTLNAPPQTAGLEPTAIIADYYEGQNALDISRLEDSLAKGVKSPLSFELTNLFVTSRMRLANENIDPHMTPDEWIASGREPIPETYYVYGVTDLRIERTGEDSWQAITTLYTPYQYDSTQTSDSGTSSLETPKAVTTYVYEQTTDFTLAFSERGWWEITSVGNSYIELRDVIEIPYIPR